MRVVRPSLGAGLPSVGGSMTEVSMEGGLGRMELLSSDAVEGSSEPELMRRAGAGRGGGSEEESEPEEGQVEKAGTVLLLAAGRVVVADEKSTL